MHKFRLTFSHVNPGFVNLDCNAFGFPINGNIGLELYPRNSNELANATKYHIDCGGFKTEDLAIASGEKLRCSLRFLNSILDLGLNVPTEDKVTSRTSAVIKEKVKDNGAVLLNSRSGLSSIPDDGLHFESVTSGQLNVRVSDPIFLFDAVKYIWDWELNFDSKAEDVIELLNLSSRETSLKLKFLTVYFALEEMIVIKERSKDAQNLILSFIDITNSSDIPDKEKASLVGALSNLKHGAFSGALKTFSRTITEPKEIQGFSPIQLASKAIELRNKIAHNSEILADSNIENITKGIRQMVLGLLWRKYNIPDFSIYRPADKVICEKFETRVL